MSPLVASVAAKLGCSEAQAKLTIDAVFLAILEAARTTVRGFGSFSWRQEKLVFRPAKTSRVRQESAQFREASSDRSS